MPRRFLFEACSFMLCIATTRCVHHDDGGGFNDDDDDVDDGDVEHDGEVDDGNDVDDEDPDRDADDDVAMPAAVLTKLTTTMAGSRGDVRASYSSQPYLHDCPLKLWLPRGGELY
eukprot:3083711-Rhodomonas_salina.1